MPKVAALVPMRHNSERVPGKNYRLFGDAPLFHHIVRTLLNTPAVDEVLIDTDSPTIAEQCSTNFPEIRVVDRPAALLGGDVPMNRIIEHDLTHTDASVIVQTHSTNPLLRSATIGSAIQRFLSEDCDSAFTVTRLQQRLWDSSTRPLNHDPMVLHRTQDLDPVWIENSCAFVFGRDLVPTTGSRIGRSPIMIETDPIESLDIDEEADFVVAEAMWKMHRSP